MAPNYLVLEEKWLNDAYTETSVEPKINVKDKPRIPTTATFVTLPDAVSPSPDLIKNEEDERNDEEVHASKSAEGDREADLSGDEGEVNESGLVEPQSSDLFTYENKGSDSANHSSRRPLALFTDEDPGECKIQNHLSPQSMISGHVSSHCFRFPKINTSAEKKSSSPLTLRAPPAAAFFSSMRLPSHWSSQRASPTGELFSPSSAGVMEDVDLQQSKFAENETDCSVEEIEESENVSASTGDETKKESSSSPKTESSPPSMFVERWENFKDDILKSTSSSTTWTTSSPGSSWFDQSMKSMSLSMGNGGTGFSSISKKTWKKFNRDLKDFLNEDISKDAYMKQFGTQVSRGDNDANFENFGGGEIWETYPEKEMYPNAI